MAVPNEIPFDFDTLFPHGFGLLGAGQPVKDYDRSTKDNFVQAMHKDSGLPLWQFEGMDLDPEAKKAMRIVTIKIAAQVQPVPASSQDLGPFKLVRFEGLRGKPYVKRDGDFTSLAWSFSASGFASAAGTRSEKAA